MKRVYFRVLLALSMIVLLTNCRKFLDVQPEDKVLEEQTFTTPKGINMVLNGLYLDLAKNDLYGNRLTLSTVDILAQRYDISSLHSQYKIATYAYTDLTVMDSLDKVWTNAYALVLNTNTFLESLDKYPGVLSPAVDSLYRGEAIGMRAMLHFDMLRLYGPMYNSADSTKPSIPYYRSLSKDINPLLPANAAIDSVLSDLNIAERLLANDPIRVSGVQRKLVGDGNDFLRARNYRFNYYAIKALKARVNMYRGNKPAALAAAVEVINVRWFPWVSSNNVLVNQGSPDRVFTTEMILGVQNTKLYDKYEEYFAPTLADSRILAPTLTKTSTVFEADENDFRYNLNWKVPTDGGKTYRTFFKYADIVRKDSIYRFTIPLIKKSEMYYIAAECSSDLNTAATYLNTVRNNRGLTNRSITTTALLNTELQKEHQKEFFGEGQLFYYYKRRNLTSIPTGTSAASVSMNASKYGVPLPLSETQYR
ncbi:RagB/SusD family nutrient uptake outer membrane protein [Desertivirga arenae]|uniref:RagB/SusD family nutrient uptake outer membrane protein n=1 Tax=Desertivirga arenae TaxID=2810309 RepID=UPI001A96B5AF|nr:RagB/SusD family nutrient uptake outer membrane protein [Pedobacter sp. SYSU D00823]